MSDWELLLYFVVLAATLVPLAYRWKQRPIWIFASLVGLGSIFAAIFSSPTPEVLARRLPQPATSAGYVSSNKCQSCHPGSYASWHRTFHRTMTQVATPEAVIPEFDRLELQSRGRIYVLHRRDDEFWAEMNDPGWEMRAAASGVDVANHPSPQRVDMRIVMTTGSHRHQTYWVLNDSGVLIQFPWVYHINTDRWVFRNDSFLKPPDDKATFNIWNQTCIDCHSTGGQPRIDHAAATMHSQGELGISCEACHGPADEHVRVHQNPLNRYLSRISDDPDSTIVNPARCSPKQATQICGQCHSFSLTNDGDRWSQTGRAFRPGDELEATRHIFRLGETEDWMLDHDKQKVEHVFWPDGTCRTGGREFNGLIESSCYQRGEASCLSCHSMHDSDPDDQLARQMEGDEACLQCHTDFRDRIAEHTHHAVGSSGSKCYNCHMPHTTYALFGAIRSHRIQSPHVATTVESGRPIACNLCHLDKTIGWTADHLATWYGAERPELTDDEEEIAASLLWLLRGDAAQRVVTAWNMGWEAALETSGREWQAPILSQLLDDPYSAVRYVAFESLRKQPGYDSFSFAFDGPAETRRQAVEAAIQHWQGTEKEFEPALLLNENGGVNWGRVRALLDERDDREIRIVE